MSEGRAVSAKAQSRPSRLPPRRVVVTPDMVIGPTELAMIAAGRQFGKTAALHRALRRYLEEHSGAVVAIIAPRR